MLTHEFLQRRSRDLKAERDNSVQLDQFLRKDFRSIPEELGAIFKVDPPKTTIFPPLVWKYARLTAPQYVHPPHREFKGGTEAGVRDLEAVYANARMDPFLRAASRRLAVQNSQLIAVDVLGRDRVRPLAFNPGKWWADFDDPLATDIRDATRVEVMVPLKLKRYGNSATLEHAKRVYTKTEAWTEDMEGNKRPIFGKMRHGLGYVPLYVASRAEPEMGWPMPPVPHDLLAMQIALTLALSQMLHIAMRQSFDREYLIGVDAHGAIPDKFGMGPGRINTFERPGVDESLQHVLATPNPPLQKYIAVVDTALRIWSEMNDIPTQSLEAITGDARAMDRLDIETEQLDFEGILRDLEWGVCDLSVDLLNAHQLRGVAIPKPSKLALDYHYVEPQLRNDLQEAQAFAINAHYGRLDPFADVAKAERLTRDEARETVVERLKLARDLFAHVAQGQDIPGLDRTASAMENPSGDKPAETEA